MPGVLPAPPWGSALDGLPLGLATPSGWSKVALGDLDALLSDHAHCEKKAASAALSLLSKGPEDDTLVRSMVALAHEEIRHFRQVYRLLVERGGRLGRPSADRYVRELRSRGFQHKGGIGPIADLLLLNGLIEARSCERLRLLVEGLDRGEGDLPESDRQNLLAFYVRLAGAEGRHWELFRDLATRFARPEAIHRRLEELAGVEGNIVAELPFEPRMH